jgi:chromosome segregation ATPase
MNKFILLLVLISGFLSGYLIGDYRSKNARETLKMAFETGKTLDSEQEAAIAQLRTQLDGINNKHQRELDTIRKENALKVAEWRRTKDTLDDKIKSANASIEESDTRLKALVAQRDGSSGTEEAGLNLEIARLRKERENLRREIEGNACLQARVPHSVFNALGDAGGRK